MYQNLIPFGGRKLLITDAGSWAPCSKKTQGLSLCLAQPSREKLNCVWKPYKGNVNWGIKACVFGLPRTCGSPIIWILFLMTQVGAKPAVRRAKGTKLDVLAAASPFTPRRKLCLYVFSCDLHLQQPSPDLRGHLPALQYRPVFSAFSYFCEHFCASLLELPPPQDNFSCLS